MKDIAKQVGVSMIFLFMNLVFYEIMGFEVTVLCALAYIAGFVVLLFQKPKS